MLAEMDDEFGVGDLVRGTLKESSQKQVSFPCVQEY